MTTHNTPETSTDTLDNSPELTPLNTAEPEPEHAHTQTEASDDPSAPNGTLSNVNRDIEKTYDEQVYTSNAFHFSSPGHLRAAAHLYNLDSVPLENARVLELGCAGGGNLLPFAIAYPNAHVVGVDLSTVQIEQGQQVVQALGLKNLHLKAMSLTDITPEFGQFDYIISHGVFSWIPPEVREAMMRIVRDNLAPNGVAYISYNTYPGWKAGDIVRDAMLLHSHSAQNEADKLTSAKAMLNLLSEGIAPGNALAPSLRAAVAQVRTHSDYYIAHEYLEIFNNPCYLLEFVNMADQHNLTHAGDVEPHVEISSTYGANVQLHHSLVAMGQPREVRQQYLDFAVGRNFRKSLIVHKERSANIPKSPDLDKLTDLHWAGHFTEAPADEKTPKGRRKFRNHKNRIIYSNDPVILALFNALTHAWPATLSVQDLQEHAQTALGNTADTDTTRKQVLDALKTLFGLNCLRYSLEPGPYDTTKPSDSHGNSPTLALVPGLAHLMQQRSNPAFGIGLFNLWHENIAVTLKDAEHFLLQHMNGTHTRKQLATLLRDALHRGDVISTDGKSLKGQRNLDATADKTLGRLLDLLKRQGLLLSTR